MSFLCILTWENTSITIQTVLKNIFGIFLENTSSYISSRCHRNSSAVPWWCTDPTLTCKQRNTAQTEAGQTSLDVVACTNHLWAATFPAAGRQYPSSRVKTFVVHLKIMGWAMVFSTLPVPSVLTLPFSGSILNDVLLGRMMSKKGGLGASPQKLFASRKLLSMWQEFSWLS